MIEEHWVTMSPYNTLVMGVIGEVSLEINYIEQMVSSISS